MGTIRVGIVGLGMGRSHLTSYRKLPGVEVVALADTNERRLKRTGEEFKVSLLLGHYSELLKLKDVDAVSICLPNFLHAPASIEALRKGKHVLVEKPPAINAAELKKMIRAAREHQRVLMVALNNRFRPDVQALRRIIKKGELGEIYYARAGWLRRVNYAGGWFKERSKSGGGALLDLGIHAIDLSLYLMDSPEPISVAGSTYTKLGRYDVEDLALGLVRLKGGTTLSIEISWELHEPRIEPNEIIFVDLMGTKGGATLEPLRIRKRIRGDPVEIFPSSPEGSWQGSVYEEVGHFMRCIRSGKEPISSGRSALSTMKIIDGIYESSKRGREVALK